MRRVDCSILRDSIGLLLYLETSSIEETHDFFVPAVSDLTSWHYMLYM